MNAVNRTMDSVFDVLLTPFELMGPEVSLLLVSGVFGILALLAFKQISWQKGIKAAKDRIKGHMIAIRLYQDDLVVVGKSVLSILGRNGQYIGLNAMPFLPLLIPFALVLAQLVVRYGFDPVPVVELPADGSMPRDKNTIQVSFARGAAGTEDLEIEYPDGIVPLSKLVVNRSQGKAFQHFAAVRPADGTIRILVGGKPVAEKEIVAGDRRTRSMQPERVAGFWAWMWPAEDSLSGSPVERIAFVYPERDLRFLPGGVGGIVLTFLVASMAFGLLILKPLNIQI